MNLNLLDLNLLVVFDAVMRERSVTRASQRLGMTQPAVSNAIGRLRELVGDPLFVRRVGGVQPTARALELAEPVSVALRGLETALDQTEFEPQQARRTFRISLSDQAVIALLPALARRIARSAPNVDLRVQPKALPSLPSLLDTNQIDLAVGVFEDVPARFSSTTLYLDRYVCMMSGQHPLTRRELTLQEYANAHHLSVRAVDLASAFIDRILERQGLSRRIAMTVNQFMTVPEIIAETPLIVSLFERTVGHFHGLDELDVSVRPLPVEPVPIKMVWHTGLMNLRAHRWLRDQLIAVAQEDEAA